MYCPRCAVENGDRAKFCRACGANLETVALALAGKLPVKQAGDEEAEPKTVAGWLEKQGRSVRDTTVGAIMLGVTILIGIIPLFLIANPFPWIVIWTVFFGWLGLYGVYYLSTGIGGMMQARTMLRGLERLPGELPPTTAPLPLPLTGDRPALAANQRPPGSVTEGTTKLLDEQQQDRKGTAEDERSEPQGARTKE